MNVLEFLALIYSLWLTFISFIVYKLIWNSQNSCFHFSAKPRLLFIYPIDLVPKFWYYGFLSIEQNTFSQVLLTFHIFQLPHTKDIFQLPHSQGHLDFIHISTPKSFSTGMLSIVSSLSLYSCLRLPQPGSSTLHLDLSNLIRFASLGSK